MATHLGLAQALRVMRDETTRSGLDKWRKESLVDTIMSLAFTARAIPGVLHDLEAAHTLSIASPSKGGGMEAAIEQLSKVVRQSHSDGAAALPPGDNRASEASEATGEVSESGQNNPHAGNSQGFSGPAKPICRSLWKGKECENPATCDRAHRPLCMLEACKSSRNLNCHNWHYIPKKQKSPANRSAQGPASKGSGNAMRGRSAPASKSGKHKPLRHMSQATEQLYLKLKLSKIELEQSKMAAATYRDILASNPSGSGHVRPQGPPLAASAPVLPPPAHKSIHQDPPSPVNLGPIVAQLQAITAALTAAGIMNNTH